MVKSKDRRPGGLYSFIGSGVPHICLKTALEMAPDFAATIEIWPGYVKETAQRWADLKPIKSFKFQTVQKKKLVRLIFGKKMYN